MDLDCSFSDLAGKSVFITGGGSGIGAALTEGFLTQGAKVAFVGRSDASEFCDKMEENYSSRPLFISCDVTNIDDLRAAMVKTREENGPIQVLVNNAANDVRHELADYEPADWDLSMNTNLRPYFFTAQAVVDDMKSQGGGSIINYSSISYMMGLGDYAAYVTAKAGITGLSRGLARELGPDNIRVNALMPGWVLTQRQLDLWASEEALAAHMDRQCLKEHLVAEDMVGATLFLASRASRMMTGQALVVDGGTVVSG